MNTNSTCNLLPKGEALEHLVALLKRDGVAVDPRVLEAVIRDKWKSLSLFAHSIHYAFEMEVREAARLEGEKKAKKETGQ